MRKAVMILLALAAIRLLPKALRREAAALELFTVLLQTVLATAATSKATATEARTATLEVTAGNLKTSVTTQTNRVNNLSGGNTSTSNLSDSQISGVSDNPAVTGYVVTTSGNYNGGTLSTHNHSYGHQHGRGSYAVGNGNHAHSLPNV